MAAVKDQGKCSGCYAFAAAAALEGIYKIKRGQLIDMSQQQLIDCTKSYRNAGCKGGFMTNCYKYLAQSKIMRANDYPYIVQDGDCKYVDSKGITKIASYTELPKNNPRALMEAVARQPVSIGISAFCSVFMLYKGGVLTKGCGTVPLNHAVTLIGYGRDQATGLDFWLI